MKTKAPEPRPAEDLYISAYFQKMRRYVRATCDDWRITSALYGLVQPREVIAPYNLTLNDMSRSEQRLWAEKVMAQIQASFADTRSTVLEVHGGRGYTRDLVSLLNSAGYHVVVPTPAVSIGERMHWYDRHTPPLSGARLRTPPEDSLPRFSASSVLRPAKRRPRGLSQSRRAEDFRKALVEELDDAFRGGCDHLDVVAGDLHRRVGGYPGPDHRLATCCTVMRGAMTHRDRILAQPPSGVGANVIIRYELPRRRTAVQ